MTVYTIKIYTVLNLLSDLGGFFMALLSIFSLIAFPLNRAFLISKIAREIYIGKNKQEDEMPSTLSSSLMKTKFKFTKKDSQKLTLCNVLCCCFRYNQTNDQVW